MSAQSIPRIKPEEYLVRDRAAEVRSEYYDGQMYSMAGGTYIHALLIGNLQGALVTELRGGPCKATPTEARLRISDRAYVYPDLMVICGGPHFAHDQRDTVTNPTVVIEVLSRTSEAHDRGYKFALYSTIRTLQEYVLVSQWEKRVEVLRRQPEGKWLLSVFTGDDTCSLESIDCQAPLADIYDQVDLSEPPSPQPA
jgi:Uma2 family endonuclease